MLKPKRKLRFKPDCDGVLRAIYQDNLFHWHFAIHIDGKREIRWSVSSHHGSESAQGVATNKAKARRLLLDIFCAFTGLHH